MDHSEARELLDLAATEPGGLDRLMAGDTPSAIALAGHLAGCDACTEEFGRLRRFSAVLRSVISTQPRPELRAQTLEFVVAVGRPRGPTAASAREVPVAVEGVRVADPTQAAEAPRLAAVAADDRWQASGGVVVPWPTSASDPARRRGFGRLGLLAAAAALVIATAGITGFAVSSLRDTSARQASLQLEGLAEVALWTIRLDAEPDVRHVTLTAAGPAGDRRAVGTLIFSPRIQQVVIVGEGLANPPADHEYRCWVEIGGAKQRLGKMYLSGDLGFWVGDASILADVPDGSVFGVSLADLNNAAGGPSPTILSGTLQAI